MESIFQKLKNLDAYPKVNEDFYNRTLSGGVITIVSSLIMLLLFLSEFMDTSRGQTLRINFDVTFPSVRCSLVSLDAMDISGEQHLDIRHDITKKRINLLGDVIEATKDGIGAPKIENPLQKHGGRLVHNESYCGSCFGAEASDDECCNSCEEVREAYRKKGWALSNFELIDQCKREGYIQKVKDEEGEGCNIVGSLDVNKVAGQFLFIPATFHQSSFFLHEMLDFRRESYNISHRINKLTFGDYFPGVVNPLDGVQWTHEKPNGVQQYFIKVVPTAYTNIRGRTVHTNQYSVTEHYKEADYARFDSLPGIFFIYDFSPIKVNFKEEHMSFLHFMTSVCAIIGGIFTIAGIIDAFVYHGQRAIKKKVEIGKYG